MSAVSTCPTIWLNGDLRAADAAISVHDRGLLLGESVFETILVKNQVPQFWAAHLARLQTACKAFELACPYNAAGLRDGVLALLAAQTIPRRGVLRITITGGAGGRGLVAGQAAGPNVIMQISEAPPHKPALQLADCTVRRMAGADSTAHKTGTYIDNIMARRQALKAGADEAVMMNQHGRIACAAAGNLFVAQGDTLITPPVSEGALPGIIRAALLDVNEIDGMRIEEAAIEMATLHASPAIFITNSLNGVAAAAYIAATEAQKKQGLALNEALPEFDKF